MAIIELQKCFVAEIDDVPLYIQIIKLEKQCYVWIASGEANLTSLNAAMPTRFVSKAAFGGGRDPISVEQLVNSL
jgi:hypothetical protein